MREQQHLPLEHQYLRCVEQHNIPGNNEFQLVICMTSRMSSLLIQAKRISINTSFKRVRGWQEFEIEGWDNTHQQCKFSFSCGVFFVGDYMSNLVAAMTLARAFTTLQSADAHVILFRRIFEIAVMDAGTPVQFLHIHGMGIESVIADGHRGQALGRFLFFDTHVRSDRPTGLGKFCVELYRDVKHFCSYEPHRRICDLDPYDHLRRFFRVCVVHFKRNIQPLKHELPRDVVEAMYSVASAEPHYNFEATLAKI